MGLALATLALYAPVVGFEFVDYDDRTYVSENLEVQRGLGPDTIAWAFTTTVASHWHPVTMLSHAAAWTLFGPWAGGHHALNVLLHVGNVLLLFALLLRATRALGRSALVAALFAVHPLRVESVAWVAERKDVLSALFFFGALHAYVGWVRRGSRWRYGLVAALFVLGLMAKAMVVTLPLVLLLLDRWPLGRTERWWRLVGEKMPLVALAAGSVVVTMLAATATTQPLARLALSGRIENAVVSLATYLAGTIWPRGQAVLYMHPGLPGGAPPGWPMFVASAAVLLGMSVWVFRERDRGYLVTGWGWYVGMLLPVLGLVQAGLQARADRYTYLPLIGPCLMVVWRMGDWLDGRALAPMARRLAVAGAILLVASYAAAARSQLGTWRDSETLYRHALAVEPRNFMMHFNLGTVLAAAGRSAEALAAFRRTLEIHPRYPRGHRTLALELERAGRSDEALTHFREAVRLDPSDAASLRVLGDALAARGETAEAGDVYRRALALDAADAHAENNLGNLLLAGGDVTGARAAYERALALDPGLAGAHGNLAALLEQAGDQTAALPHRWAHVRLDPASADACHALAVGLVRAGVTREAVSALRETLRLDPNRSEARQLLAWLLATQPGATAADGAEAVREAERLVQATHGADATVSMTLAVAHGAAGNFSAALAQVEAARRLAAAAGEMDIVRALDAMEASFRRGEAYREPS